MFQQKCWVDSQLSNTTQGPQHSSTVKRENQFLPLRYKKETEALRTKSPTSKLARVSWGTGWQALLPAPSQITLSMEENPPNSKVLEKGPVVVTFMLVLTCLFSRSILFPNTTKGKFSGSRGLAWIRNSSLQLSRVLNVLGAVTSNTRTQQSAPL